MKQFSGFEAKKQSIGREILPAGGYVCEIKSAKEEDFSWGSRLVLAIEVVEGKYTGFFKKDYDSNDREDKKWRGTYRITIPADDGSERDGWTKRTFGNLMYSIENSNPGYHWDWDEKGLKGKKLGVLFRNKEWEMNGRTGWTTEAAGSCTVEDIRNKTFRLLKDKPLKNRPETQNASVDEVESESELPF